jgi:hypothetical protein
VGPDRVVSRQRGPTPGLAHDCGETELLGGLPALALDRSAGQETATDFEDRGFAAESIPSGDTGPEQSSNRCRRPDQARRAEARQRRTLSLIAARYSYCEVGRITGFPYENQPLPRAAPGCASWQQRDGKPGFRPSRKMLSYRYENDRLHQGPDRLAG